MYTVVIPNVYSSLYLLYTVVFWLSRNFIKKLYHDKYFFVFLFPCITVKISDFCLVFLSYSSDLPFFDVYLILENRTCQFFRQVGILRSVPDCALLEIRLPDWSIYSLTCKSSMFDHHLIVVLLEVGNGRTSSETDVRFFLFCTVKNEFCTVQLNYICNLIV